MITFCLNNENIANEERPDSFARLLFVCKALGKDAAMPRTMHKHEERFELMFIVRGGGIFNIDGRKYVVTKGDILLFNSGVLHDENPTPSADLEILSCGVDRLKITGLPLNNLTQRTQLAVMTSGSQYEAINSIFHQMSEYTLSTTSYSNEVATHLLNALLNICKSIWMDNHIEEERLESEVVHQVRDMIVDNYKQGLLFNDITEKLNLDKFLLNRLFKYYVGYPPKQFLTRMRIGEAQSLLLTTNLSLPEIASEVGYENINNFHRIFNNVVGMSPLRYKKFWLAQKK